MADAGKTMVKTRPDRAGARQRRVGDGTAPAPATDQRDQRRPLAEVSAGESVEVVEQELAGEEAGLLSALGIVRGSRLVVRASGDPCIVEVRAARVGIARRVAARVLVQPTQR